MKSCELENYYDDYKPMKITLDENLSPNANAQRYFKKYAKEKRAVEIVTPQKEQTEKDLDYLGSGGHELSLAADKSDFKDIEEELISQGLLPAPKNKSVKTAESPYREYIADGYAIKCGKNNLQNDRLLSRVPFISASFCGAFSSTSSVLSPNLLTMSAAVAGPMPRTAPPARYS